MDEQRDYGIAVVDAVRLSDCWRKLSDALIARPSLDGDEAHWSSDTWGSRDNEHWVHMRNSQEVAIALLRKAISNQELPLWVRLADNDCEADANALNALTAKAMKVGAYASEGFPKSNLEGRPLWIKKNDWNRFFADTMAERYNQQTGILDAHNSNTARNDDPIVWSDFGEDELPELERLHQLLLQDEWWSWPEAIAWVGSRDSRNIATLRYWRQTWMSRGDGDATIAVSAQGYIARKYCTTPQDTENGLLNAIMSGAIETEGRASRDARSTSLRKGDWRGGAVVFSDGSTNLVSSKNQLIVWAFDIAVKRKDLMEAFRPTALSNDISLYAGGINYVLEDDTGKADHLAQASQSSDHEPIRHAPSVKKGRPPSDDKILARADEMKKRGMGSQAIAKGMRLEKGFENAGTVHVRQLICGRWSRGRPKSKNDT